MTKKIWTHEYRLGKSSNWFPCRVKCEVGTQGVVIEAKVYEGEQYCSFYGDQAIELREIKKTATQDQVDFLLRYAKWSENKTGITSDLMNEYIDMHKVVQQCR